MQLYNPEAILLGIDTLSVRIPKPTKGDVVFRSFKILFLVVVVLLLAAAVLMSVATADVKASRVVYHGYILKGELPSKDQCVKYQKTHSGAERWRLWIRRYTYQMIRFKNAGAKNWRRAWNEDWVIPTIWGESRGLQNPGGYTFRGLMQIWIKNVNPKDYNHLNIGWFNLRVAARMFASPQPWMGPHPWNGGPPVSANPYCPHI